MTAYGRNDRRLLSISYEIVQQTLASGPSPPLNLTKVDADPTTMLSLRHNWLASPNVSWLWATVAAGIWSLLLVLVQNSDVGDYLDARLARPADFRVREWLGKSPRLSEHLKIYSIDDSTFSSLGSWFCR